MTYDVAKIVNANFLWLALRTALPAAVLEIAHQFPLLRIHGNGPLTARRSWLERRRSQTATPVRTTTTEYSE